MLLVYVWVFAGAAYSGMPDTIVADIRAMDLQEVAYEFGTIEAITIVPGKKAVRLVCSANPEGIKEVLIGADSQVLSIYSVLSSGIVRGIGSTPDRMVGSFCQVGEAAAVGTWTRHEDRIDVEFQLTCDDDAIIQAWRALAKAGSFSRRIQCLEALLGDPGRLYPRISAAERVEAFTRLWSLVKYNFANFDLAGDPDWDRVLTDMLPQVMQDQSNSEYLLLLQRCLALLRDGHTDIHAAWGDGRPHSCPPLEIRSVGGRAIVVRLAETQEVTAAGIRPGDEITHVDGRPVAEFLETEIYPYVFASTPQSRDLKAYPCLLHGPRESTVSVRIRRGDGTVHEATLTREVGGLSLLPEKDPPRGYECRDLGDGIVYVNLDSFGDDTVVRKFREHLPTICKAHGLIVDVRQNGGGNSSNGDAITAHLIEKGILGTNWKTPMHIAAHEAWGRPKQWYYGVPQMIQPAEGKRYTGPLVILIGPETFSAAEDFVVPLHAAGRARLVGRRTGGSTGQPLRFHFLEGKISGRVCTKRDTYPDGHDFVGVGIIPDVEVEPTADDLSRGRDVVLEKAAAMLKQ